MVVNKILENSPQAIFHQALHTHIGLVQTHQPKASPTPEASRGGAVRFSFVLVAVGSL